MFSKLYRFLFGYDFFVSYSRADGSFYALSLARELTIKGFTVYLDQWGSDPAKKIPRTLIRILINSKFMVLLSTRKSRVSENVAQEIKEFLATGKVIIPISTAADHHGALWEKLVVGMAVTRIPESDLENGRVNEQLVLSRLVNSFSYTRQRSRIKRIAWGLGALAVLIPVTFGITYLLMGQKITAKNRELNSLDVKFKKDSAAFSARMGDTTKILSNIRKEVRLASSQLDKTNKALKLKGDSLGTVSTQGQELFDISSEILTKIRYAFEREQDYYQANPIPNTDDIAYNAVFMFNSSVLYTSAYPMLDGLSARLRGSNSKIVVWGFASMFGLGMHSEANEVKNYRWGKFDFQISSAEYLKQLSQDRANSIKTYLVNSGVPAANISTKGYGDNRPKSTLGFFSDRAEIHFVK